SKRDWSSDVCSSDLTARTDVDHSPATLAKKPLGWAQEGQDWTLLHGGTLLGAAVTGASMAPVHSPRPHLHPVRSLQGQAMTVTKIGRASSRERGEST